MVTTRAYLVVSMLLSPLCIFAGKEHFENNPPEITPYQIASLACVAYEHHKHKAQKEIDKKCPGLFEIVIHKEHHAVKDGGRVKGYKEDDFNISVIIAKHRTKGTLHVAVEGREAPDDTTQKDKKNVHDIICSNINKQGGRGLLKTIISHTMGGVLLRKICEKYPEYYAAVTLITFNAPLYFDSGNYDNFKNILSNEIAFACKAENDRAARALLSQQPKKAIEVHSSVGPHVGKDYPMKHFLHALEQKTWQTFLK